MRKEREGTLVKEIDVDGVSHPWQVGDALLGLVHGALSLGFRD